MGYYLDNMKKKSIFITFFIFITTPFARGCNTVVWRRFYRRQVIYIGSTYLYQKLKKLFKRWITVV